MTDNTVVTFPFKPRLIACAEHAIGQENFFGYSTTKC